MLDFTKGYYGLILKSRASSGACGMRRNIHWNSSKAVTTRLQKYMLYQSVRLQEMIFTNHFCNKCFFTWIFTISSRLLSRAETFAGRNFPDFPDFGPFSRKLMPGKKLNEKLAKVILAKDKLFQISFESLKNRK